MYQKNFMENTNHTKLFFKCITVVDWLMKTEPEFYANSKNVNLLLKNLFRNYLKLQDQKSKQE